MSEAPLHLFGGYGIELEYMIVDAGTLAPLPLADEVLRAVGGGYEMEVGLGPVAWSNELALHVIELKTNGPAPALAGVTAHFDDHVGRIEDILAPHGARLMPTGMHPFMDPERDLRLWPHENSRIYATFHRIFDCRGHGWANLQSTHCNLPFHGDDEFGRLHAAVRIVLPLVPALAASSPVADGRTTGYRDTRLEHYRRNCARVASVTGSIVPERVFTRDEYERGILRRIYDDLAPLDPEGIIRHEWVNARGAIARFDRMAIEIRLLDAQECPAADVAVVGAVAGVVRAIVEGRLAPEEEVRSWDEGPLAEMLLGAIRSGEDGLVHDPAYLRCLGFPDAAPARLGDIWRHLIRTVLREEDVPPEARPCLDVILRKGTLSRRIGIALGEDPDRIRPVYGRLCDSLRDGEPFDPDAL